MNDIGIETACALIGVSRATFYSYLYRGFLPPGERRMGRLFWPRAVIVAFAETRDERASRGTVESRAIAMKP